jgi:hypothetical protein
VVANAGRARIFAEPGGNADSNNSELEEINDMVNAAVRLRTAETETDRLGPTWPPRASTTPAAHCPTKATNRRKRPPSTRPNCSPAASTAFCCKA